MEKKINTKIISDYLEKNNLTNLKFCKIVHVTTRNFSNIMTNRKNTDENSVLKIANYLGLKKKICMNSFIF